MSYNQLIITNNGALRTAMFNNVKKKNALNREAYIEITKALNEAAADDTVTVLALTGAGDFYSSGNDLTAILDSDNFEDALDKSSSIVRSLVHAFIRFPKLLVAVVNGPCIGIAATTVVLCDIVYAADTVCGNAKRTAGP